MQKELFYPQLRAQIGQYALTRGLAVEVYSAQDSYFDWVKVNLAEQYKGKIHLAKGARAVIELGYDNVFDQVFEGYINDATALSKIILKDEMALLEATSITQTFLDTTPQEIISFCLTKAGVTKAKLSTKAYPAKRVVSLSLKNVVEVIEAIHGIWGIREQFYFQDGAFYWGERPEQSQVYTFEYGVNIIALTRGTGAWELETVSAPFVKHSQIINVVHPQIAGAHEVRKVVFATNDAGFVRTRIYF